jgi:hypothetical protein
MFSIIITLIVVIIPFAKFYYKEDEEDIPEAAALVKDWNNKFLPAVFKSTLITGSFLIISLLLYSTTANISVPITINSYSLDDLMVTTVMVSSGESPYNYIDMTYYPDQITNSGMNTMSDIGYKASYPVYLTGIYLSIIYLSIQVSI